jgi:hypothetical protein
MDKEMAHMEVLNPMLKLPFCGNHTIEYQIHFFWVNKHKIFN